MGIFKKLFGRKEGKEIVERDQLPPLPDEAFIQEVSDTCTFNTKTKEMKVSLELHDIVLNVPVSTKTYQSPGCRKSRIHKDTDYKNFTVFHCHRDGEQWMDFRNIEHITAIKFRDGNPVEAFDTDINTRRSNPKYAAKYPDAPTFKEVAGDFDNFVGDDNLVAFYIEDEAELLYYSGSRAAKRKGKKYGLRKEAEALLRLDDYRFDSVMNYYGVFYQKDDLPGSTIAAGYLFMLLAEDVIAKEEQGVKPDHE